VPPNIITKTDTNWLSKRVPKHRTNTVTWANPLQALSLLVSYWEGWNNSLLAPDTSPD